MTLRFLDTPIESVVRAIAEAAGINYVLAPDVSGRVTVVTQVPIPEDQVVSLLLAALETHGFTAVRAGPIHKIIRGEGARERAVTTGRGPTPRPGIRGDEVVTHIVPLRFTAATDLASQLRPLMSTRGHIGTHSETNSLLLTDAASNVARLLAVVRILDVERALEGLEVFPLRFADAPSLAATLNRIFAKGVGAAAGLPAAPPAPRGPEGRADGPPLIVGERRANALIVHARPDELEAIRRLVAQLDADLGPRRRLLVYRAEHADAVELAATLRASYVEVDPHARFVPDAATNTLFVVTSPNVRTAIEATLRQLDRRPRQVQIEVIAAEVDLIDEQRLGIDWAAVIGSLTAVALTGPVPPVEAALGLPPLALASEGLTGLVAETDAALILLRTLAVTKVARVTARPQILAAEGKRAVLKVSDSIPVVTASPSPGLPADALLGIVTQVVEYRDAGVVLSVQPRIGQDGAIALDVRQEVNELGEREPSTGSRQIIKRELESSVVLRDTQTLVLGGLVRELRDVAERGVPLLKDVPILGRLFRTREERTSRRELLILVTPRIVHPPESSVP
ncbi:MAG TPA: secretin N-terminal domain-containing protein [Methylomirabilota bacterium]|nr:secretin N-terminal domain-containing protein [Methylomirabilota bacterium]